MTFYNPTYTFVAGTVAQSGQVNTNFTGISTVINGNLDTNNLSASAGIKNTQCANCDSQFIMGGASNARPLPTSSAWVGEYWHTGNWVQSGTITSQQARIHVFGNMTFNANITASIEFLGGPVPTSTSATIFSGYAGVGFGCGYSGGIPGVAQAGGGGGGFGGAGGTGGSNLTSTTWNNGGNSYYISSGLNGSSGGSSSTLSGNGVAGGLGGASMYIECTGSITFLSTCQLRLNGGNGNGGNTTGSGGGSGGGLVIRALGGILLNSGSLIAANGGNGGNGTTVSGGGGGGGYIDISGSSIVNAGSITATGGLAGTTQTAGNQPTAGSLGVIALNQFIQNVRSAG